MQLTRSISTDDFQHGGAPVPPEYLANAQAMANLLQDYMDATGIDVIITSGYRPPADNAGVGGVGTSQHLTASALDFVPRGTTIEGCAAAFLSAQASGNLPDFGQMELDPTNGHIHLSLPGGHVNDTILRQDDGTYVTWSPASPDGGGAPADFPMTPTRAAPAE